MTDVVWLIPALPLAGFLILFFFGRRIGEPWSGWLASALVLAAFVLSLAVFVEVVQEPDEARTSVETLFTWVGVAGFQVKLGFLIDPLSITWMLLVTGVGGIIHVYSIGYMHGDERFHQFFMYMNLFVLSMLVLVMGDNLLVTFLGWEGVGVCSYFLISFWFTRDLPPKAGTKAFVTNRIGDAGFMLGIFVTFAAIGSLDYLVLQERAGDLATVTVAAIGLLLFVGAIGKSAQIPLFVWLPDAMQGPTPVSALIHAATMVTAGVYLMCRISYVLSDVVGVGTTIAWIGALTALIAATIACAQYDIKKVLAYSTISQLGYMFLAVGSQAYVFAVFHVLTHAFFKGLLFLSAGSVIERMHEEQDIRKMGGLFKYMPITAVCFIVGGLAISGVPPFSGFWSKDEILIYSWNKSPVLWAIGTVAAFFTAYYLFREIFYVFFGEPRWKQQAEEAEPAVVTAGAAASDAPAPGGGDHGAHGAHGHEPLEPHESPPVMTIPLIVLAILATIGGALDLPFGPRLEFLGRWLEPVFGAAETAYEPSTAWKIGGPVIAAVVAISAITVAYLVFNRHKIRATLVEPVLLQRGYYYDDSVGWVVEAPGKASWNWLAWFLDAKVIDGAVNGIGTVSRATGRSLRVLQSGFVRSYALGIAIGAVVLLGWFLVAAGG